MIPEVGHGLMRVNFNRVLSHQISRPRLRLRRSDLSPLRHCLSARYVPIPRNVNANVGVHIPVGAHRP